MIESDWSNILMVFLDLSFGFENKFLDEKLYEYKQSKQNLTVDVF